MICTDTITFESTEVTEPGPTFTGYHLFGVMTPKKIMAESVVAEAVEGGGGVPVGFISRIYCFTYFIFSCLKFLHNKNTEIQYLVIISS